MAREANAREWRPAIYARLSDEDKDGKTKGVSLSIEHQIDILRAYVKEKGWREPRVFHDDDRTGTNFDREGWQALYAEAKKGDINVIIIKDTSRFGRNWVQSGDYFTRIDEMGIRFISIQEGIDTIDPKCPALKMLPFYFIFNEWHSQTTSEKIRTVFTRQAEQGKFRAKDAPFGYDKDPSDKHRLIVDTCAAQVVKRIFSLRLQKLSYGAITNVLNEEGILSPSGYQAEKLGVENWHHTRSSLWSRSAVIRILTNPAYCGDVAHNRVSCVSYKNQKQVIQPQENWIVVRDMHEPLVSREDWQRCADMGQGLGRIRSTKDNEVSPFTGLLRCPDCGYALTRTSSYYNSKVTGERKLLLGYNCGSYRTMGKTACSSHYILENDLIELVVADIRKKAGAVLQDESAARERFYAIKAHTSGTRLNSDRNALKKVNKRLAELNKLMQAAFERSVLSDESFALFVEYAQKYEAEKHELTEQAKQLAASVERESKTESDVETFISLMKKYIDISDLDRATAVELIHHITISAGSVRPREVVIYYNLIGNVDQ